LCFRANIEESVKKLAESFHQKKFDIIIPEIKTVADVIKPTGQEEGKAAPMADSIPGSKLEEEKVSPSKAGVDSALKNGTKAAPPVPAFKAPPKTKEDAPSGIDSVYNYKPVFQMP
jgi:hypothetical protein